ncbi:MAG: ORF6N domain-containing protein [Cyclobacteriaceae bacterium]|nr:ORF6N domain-containing protein [Cyclobacteriaceae bacterium]
MNEKILTPDEVVMNKIYLIRNQKVMIDRDLSGLYGVTTGNLNKAIQRNLKRFPSDFMFKLNKEELDNLIFQFGTSSWGGVRKLPNAFTEQGVAMPSGVLNSDRAIAVNIQIIRIFTKMRPVLLTHKELLIKMNELEAEVGNHNKSIAQVFELLKRLVSEEGKPNVKIGFKQKTKG